MARTTLANCPTCRSLDTINPGLRTTWPAWIRMPVSTAVDPNFRPPESYQWNLTISHQLFKDTVLEASYIGNHGLHIWRRNVNRNDIAPNTALSRLCVRWHQSIRSTADRASFAAYRLRELRIPTPVVPDVRSVDSLITGYLRGVGNITTDESNGNSSYHALQLWLNRRFSNRLAFQAAYTWGHAISDVALTSFTNTTSDPFNFAADKGDADLDRRHTFVGNVVYVLPSFRNWGRGG